MKTRWSITSSSFSRMIGAIRCTVTLILRVLFTATLNQISVLFPAIAIYVNTEPEHNAVLPQNAKVW